MTIMWVWDKYDRKMGTIWNEGIVDHEILEY